jgi:hypothetical protein
VFRTVLDWDSLGFSFHVHCQEFSSFHRARATPMSRGCPDEFACEARERTGERELSDEDFEFIVQGAFRPFIVVAPFDVGTFALDRPPILSSARGAPTTSGSDSVGRAPAPGPSARIRVARTVPGNRQEPGTLAGTRQ